MTTILILVLVRDIDLLTVLSTGDVGCFLDLGSRLILICPFSSLNGGGVGIDSLAFVTCVTSIQSIAHRNISSQSPTGRHGYVQRRL